MAERRPFTGGASVAPPPTAPPATALGRHAVDVSNYSSPLSVWALEVWKTVHDVGLVIVQAIDPPPGYPAGQTKQQLEMCASVGMATDVYLYLWTNSNVEQDMRAKLALLNGLEHLVGSVWLDVEDVTGATVAARETSIRQALAVLDGWCSAHGKPRAAVYTGKWWWAGYLGNTTEFADRDLWASDYDGVEDTSVFRPFGGWSRCVVKQYRGTSTLAGVGNVDLNILAS